MRFSWQRRTSRREALKRLGAEIPLAVALLGPGSQARPAPRPDPGAAGPGRLTSTDDRLLDELERAGFRFFWEAAHPETGQVKDRTRADGPDEREISSIAATGFGLTVLCIADQRRYADRAALRARVRTTLRYLWENLPQQHGFYYHFVHWRSGARVWNCEISSIDTAILLCGVLTCRQHFDDAEIGELARKIYERVDWAWMLAGGALLSHGWKPEGGFLRNRWDAYCELMMIYLLAIGSPTHPIPPQSWHEWKRSWFEYQGLRYISADAPLFVHQYSHAWFDFRGRRDRHADYFENSVQATQAHRLFCLSLSQKFPHFSPELWGITASDSAKGYVVWGGPPEQGPIDGSLVPCAAGGSIPFLPVETSQVLQTMRARFGERVWKRYGFVDAFNPQTQWFNPDVIGIDVGIMALMAENARTGFVWETFMKNEEAQRAMERAGFRRV